MVEIRYPPPTRNISPQWLELEPGTTIQRIFDPTSYGSTATGFRYYGPLSRFDHQDNKQPKIDKERGIIYAGFNLSCCLVEIFGDDEMIKIQQQQIAFITLKQSLKLLDIRESGAWNAGSVAAMTSDGRRKLTQTWSRYFYENPDLYGDIEGVIFNNAHDGKPAIALYERASPQLLSADVSVLNLNEPSIRETVLAIANRLNLLVEIEA
ncbi:RES family NAD+ phosphorylase [Pleurocapsales cyanobacterium LEGE 10410]|nr:RES family NAD+ phosphorylase [Pleurocapsales cyanobacterium LEGE 10410]